MDQHFDSPRIGDRYEVLETLGVGGMGTVFRVLDRRVGRELALKRLSETAAADASVAELFEREFHTLSELAHPAIIGVYDYGIDGELPYYTMELLAFWLSNDIVGLKQLSERLAGMIASAPHWEGLMHAARCLHRLAQGDAQAALREIEPALANVQPRRHRDWTWVAVAHLHALLASGRVREAVSTAETYKAQAETHNIGGRWRITHAMAEGLILEGRAAEAAKLSDELIEQARARRARSRARSVVRTTGARGFGARRR